MEILVSDIRQVESAIWTVFLMLRIVKSFEMQGVAIEH
jgi:hypothetical protein